MSRLGRNDPCRCGSGKKYKRCCLHADEAAQRAVRHAAEEQAKARLLALEERERALLDEWRVARTNDEEDRIFVEESNAVVDLIQAGRLDEAEAAAKLLIERYPGATDGLERLGHVYETRGDMKTAAKHYRDALVQAERLGFQDDEHFVWLKELADRIDPP